MLDVDVFAIFLDEPAEVGDLEDRLLDAEDRVTGISLPSAQILLPASPPPSPREAEVAMPGSDDGASSRGKVTVVCKAGMAPWAVLGPVLWYKLFDIQKKKYCASWRVVNAAVLEKNING